MADTVVRLGGFTFQGWEVPEQMPFGGHHAHACHKLIGGRRVVDALGPDDAPIHWQGLLRGPNALSRGKQLDQMRRAGAQVSLSWFGLSFKVLIVECEINTHRFYDCAYRISCLVIDNASNGSLSAGGGTLADLVGVDLTSITGLATGVTSAAVGTAVTTLSDTIGGFASLNDAGEFDLVPVRQKAADALGTVNAAVVVGDLTLSGAEVPPANELTGQAFADAALATLAAVRAQSALVDMRGPLGRIGANLEQGEAAR